MDEGEDEEPEEQSPEDTSKMHLLLQYVNETAAAEETPQVREMRAQDFLLRALQQLNASLEAKVLEHQQQGVGASQGALPNGHTAAIGNGSGAGFSPEPRAPATAGARGGNSAAATAAALSAGYGGGSPSSQGGSSAMAPSLTSSAAPTGAASVGGAAAPSTASAGAACGGAASGSSVTGAFFESAAAAASAALPQDSAGGDANSRIAQRAQLEEMLRVRVQPYERVIAALEEKQRFYDDQEIRIRCLTKSLEDMERSNHALQARLREATAKAQADLDLERDCARQAHSDRSTRQQQIVELQQEVELRKAHEDSLQRRVALLENELSVVHERCMLVDRIEEEANSLRTELTAKESARKQLQEQAQELNRQVARHQEEACQIREDHSKELERSAASLLEEQRGQERLRQTLQAHQSAAHGKEVELRLQAERVDELMRQVATLETEVSSYKSMHEREMAHRRELEQKLTQEEHGKLAESLEEHRHTLRSLGEEASKARQESMDLKEQLQASSTELATARRQLAQERLGNVEAKEALVNLEEARTDAQAHKEQNESLREQIKNLQADLQRATGHFEQVLQERSRAEQQLCVERDESLRDVGSARRDLGQAQAELRELRVERERLNRALASAREHSDRGQDVQRQLENAQEEVQRQRLSRDEVHKELEMFVSKFQEEAFAQDRKRADLERALEDRNGEIRLLMYRVQELSSKYVPIKNDAIDVSLAKWINGYRPAVPFFRLAQGLYLFGRRQVICKISNDKPVFRVGGGFIGFDKFLELYASEELERLLSYEVDERTGDPKFVEALRVRQSLEESGVLEELRERAEVRGRDGNASSASVGGGGSGAPARTSRGPSSGPRRST
eukprot:TRINITY_DN39458_c0_g1_i1.p1 TRINITY_DN39458_c0_g1~~TRINITY_DN39458_c0_g1_i1.p1  ORF type:complete len:987 (-),score=292.40 TRINITY_DN39458_c0_g1_i1:110-2683(-)